MIGDIRKFRFWCQKVLPLVYDDSLSYYEVLCKIVQYLNKVIEDVNSIPEYIDAAIDEKLTDEHIRELLREFIVNIQSAISANNEGENTNSSADYNIGQMLWWKGQLYKVIRTIDAGDTLIAGTNIELVNFEDLFNDFADEVKHDISANDDGGNVTATQNWTAGTWLWLNDVLYIVKSDITQGNAYVFSGANANVEQITVEGEIKKGDDTLREAIQNEAKTRAEADEGLQGAIESEADARAEADEGLQSSIGNLTELTTENKNSLVDAINEVNETGGGAIEKIGDLSDLTTTDKSNVVAAINEVVENLGETSTKLSNLGIYNVLDYGAVGDGVTDDTNAIQACLDAAPAGSIVYAPNKTYLLNGTGVNIYKKGTFIFNGTYLVNSANGVGFYIDKEVGQQIIDSNIFIDIVKPTDAYSIFGTTPSNQDQTGPCGIRVRYSIGCHLQFGQVLGFSNVGIWFECDGLTVGSGTANNEIVLHNYIDIGTVAHCGIGIYLRSESAEHNCCEANEFHIVWEFGCYQDLRLDDNNATMQASTSNLFIITAIDDSYTTGGGAGVMCCSFYNKFIIAYMGCSFVCNTYSGFNDISVANTFDTDLGYTDVGKYNRFITSIPGHVDGTTRLPVSIYPRAFTPASGTNTQNDAGVPLDVYTRCHNDDGTNIGTVDVYLGASTDDMIHPIKVQIVPEHNTSALGETIHFKVPVNWFYRISYSNVVIDSNYLIQN